jgi:hypothetical protein
MNVDCPVTGFPRSLHRALALSKYCSSEDTRVHDMYTLNCNIRDVYYLCPLRCALHMQVFAVVKAHWAWRHRFTHQSEVSGLPHVPAPSFLTRGPVASGWETGWGPEACVEAVTAVEPRSHTELSLYADIKQKLRGHGP